MKPPVALSSLLVRLRPKAFVVALVAAVALILGPVTVTLAAAAPATGNHMPCEVSAGIGDHGGMTAQKQHDTSGGCASMQGAMCLTMVGVMSPTSATIGRLPPRLVSTPPLVENVLSHATSPPHRPPKHV